MVEDGIGSTNKPIIYFEGQVDQKVPIHNPALRQTGTYRAIGRILGHSFLHDGPSLCGLAEPVKHYLTLRDASDMSLNPPTLLLEDLPDIDLQMLMKQVNIIVINSNCEYFYHGLLGSIDSLTTETPQHLIQQLQEQK